MSSRKKRSDQDKKSLVRKWLTDEGFHVVSDESPDLRWLLVFHVRQAPLMVGQHVSSVDKISFRAQMKLGNLDRFLSLPKSKRSGAIQEAVYLCWGLDLDVTGLAEGHDEIIVEDHIFYDGLTKDAFIRRLRRVLRGVALIMHVLTKAVSGEESSGEDLQVN